MTIRRFDFFGNVIKLVGFAWQNAFDKYWNSFLVSKTTLLTEVAKLYLYKIKKLVSKSNTLR